MHPPPASCIHGPEPPGTLVALPDARVYSHHGVIIDSENRLRTDLSPDILPPPSGHRILDYKSLPDPDSIDAHVYCLSGLSSWKSYFHWLIDAIPRTRHARLADYDLVYSPLGKPYHTETLDRLGVPEHKRLEATAQSHFACRQLTASSPAPLCHLEPDDRSYLRALFAAPAGKPERRLYISRADAWRRRITNEDALIELIEPLGFETITLAGLTIAEQAALFSEAEAILAGHGAALTNVIFAPAGCQIIELLTSNYIYDYFEKLSKLCGLDYHRHISPNPPTNPEHPLDLERFRQTTLPRLKNL